VQRAKWATSLDKSIAYEIIDNYRKDRGNSRASLRYLEKATGARRPNVIASLRRLVEKGPISIAVPGGGTRPTAYNLDFNSVAEKPSGIADDTANNRDPSGNAGDTSVVSQTIPLDGASGNAGDTESVLQVVGLQADLLDRMSDPAAPPAPPLAGGLTAPAAGGTAADELSNAKPTFELLWRTYDFARGKREARSAWNALPAEVDRTAIIKAATAWQASWAAQGKPDAPRFTLARWLRDERYDEDAPRGFQKVERAGKTKTAKSPKAANQAAHDFPAGETKLTITAADYVQGETFSRVDFTMMDTASAEYPHSILVEHHDSSLQEAGQKELARLSEAAGIADLNDSSDFIGRHVVAVVDDDGLSWHAPRGGQPRLEPEPTPLSEPASAPKQVPQEAAKCDAPSRWPEWMSEYPAGDVPSPIRPRTARPSPRLDEVPEPVTIDFDTWRRHAGLSVEEAEAILADESDEAA
jgi:hypothetical protein